LIFPIKIAHGDTVKISFLIISMMMVGFCFSSCVEQGQDKGGISSIGNEGDPPKEIEETSDDLVKFGIYTQIFKDAEGTHVYLANTSAQKVTIMPGSKDVAAKSSATISLKENLEIQAADGKFIG